VCVVNVLRHRENKDSVIAVLEAFVHDPLINWRLLQQKVPSGQEAPTDSSLDDNGGVDLNDHPAVEATKIEVVSGSVFGSKLERRVSRTPLLHPPCDCPSTSADLCYDTPHTTHTTAGGGEAVQQDGMLNEKALEVVDRIASKLRGKDFETKQQRAALSVRDQVSKLIDQATSTENLSQCYHGWCPFW
jgi:FKBP12-rapamycin complex-associated protein